MSRLDGIASNRGIWRLHSGRKRKRALEQGLGTVIKKLDRRFPSAFLGVNELRASYHFDSIAPIKTGRLLQRPNLRRQLRLKPKALPPLIRVSSRRAGEDR